MAALNQLFDARINQISFQDSAKVGQKEAISKGSRV